jgi:ABC-type transport system substrate-binding protein
VRLRPGVFFQDDPAFPGGKGRELVAQDFVYSLLRFADPKTLSPIWPSLEEQGLLGLAERRKQAQDGAKPFDYDTPLPGLRAVDRHTLVFRLKAPAPASGRDPGAGRSVRRGGARGGREIR